MATANTQDLPEIFRPDDPTWASRAAGRGEIRRLARGLYTTNLDEPAERLIARRWADVAALYFPGSVIVDRSAADARPAEDGSLFLDVGPERKRPRAVSLPGLRLRPRSGVGPLSGDTVFMSLHMSSPARSALENLRPSRARSGVRRTLGSVELEERLDRLARIRGEEALNQLRDEARPIASTLDAIDQLDELDELIGALLGTGDAKLKTPSGAARGAGAAYDPDRLALFETLRSALAATPMPVRAEPSDPNRLLAFFEAYFSNWIEGTEFEVEEAEAIDRAQRWVSSMSWTDRDTVIETIERTNALVTPEEADRDNLHLIDA